MEHDVATVEGRGEGLGVGDVAVGQLDVAGQAGDVAGGAGERAHGVARADQRRAQAAAQVPRRARHHHPHAAAAGNWSAAAADPILIALNYTACLLLEGNPATCGGSQRHETRRMTRLDWEEEF